MKLKIIPETFGQYKLRPIEASFTRIPCYFFLLVRGALVKQSNLFLNIQQTTKSMMA